MPSSENDDHLHLLILYSLFVVFSVFPVKLPLDQIAQIQVHRIGILRLHPLPEPGYIRQPAAATDINAVLQVEKVNLAANPGAEPDKSQERIIADIFAFIFEGATPTEGATLAEGAPLAEGATPTEGAPLAEGAPIAEGAPLTEYPYITVISRGALFDSVDHLEGVEICLCVFFHFILLFTHTIRKSSYNWSPYRRRTNCPSRSAIGRSARHRGYCDTYCRW